MDKKELGYFGEKVTAYYLEKKGYKILRRNFCVKGGEIDIIAEKDGIIAFVEVKTRAPDPLVNGFEAVTAAKKRLIVKTSEAYSYRFPHDLQPRFDVVCVTVSDKKVVGFQYIENAFDASK
ncbi:MAG: YraN family protein [Oscillospiraceae bacterium]|nr:YraN family protein [Oscillospiraceae bacterium]